MAVAQRTLKVDGASVLELDEGGETLTRVAAAGLSDELMSRSRSSSSPESGNAGHTLHSSEPVVVEELATETRFQPSGAVGGFGVVSIVGISIDDLDRGPFGILTIHTCERRVFFDDEVGFLASVATLITVAVTRDRTEEATRHASLHDPLTALPNRTLALDRLAHALARRRREGINVAVLALDLDRFKVINDSMGHAAGDTVLLALAPRLLAAVRSTDTVARIGGDEFVVVCPGIDSAQTPRRSPCASRPRSVARWWSTRRILLHGQRRNHARRRPPGHARIAAARRRRGDVPGQGARTGPLRAVRRGDADPGHRAPAHRGRPAPRAGSRRARGLVPAGDRPRHQPPRRDRGFVRWRHPERGLVGPLEFIPIAEETGLIVDIGSFVLEQACGQTALWQEADPLLAVSVNVSGHQVSNPLFPAQVASIAEHSGLRPGTLALEITESVLMAEADSPASILSTLHQHGLTLALDDFGTGYSSLIRLKAYPFHQLKIDRSFVNGLPDGPDDRAIIKATIDMAHALGLIVVAEGVETAEQEECLCAWAATAPRATSTRDRSPRRRSRRCSPYLRGN